MTSEIERLKTTCLAQEAEIARLQAGFDELKESIEYNKVIDSQCTLNKIHNDALSWVIEEINRITGVKE